MKTRLEAVIPMDPASAKAIAEAAGGDKDSKRSRAEFTPVEEGLSIVIEAEDAVAMRAAINSHLRIVDSCLKCLTVIQNG